LHNCYAKREKDELVKLANLTIKTYQDALNLAPPDAIDKLAISHDHLGDILEDIGDIENALAEYQKSAQFEELQKNSYGAGQTNFKIAIMLANNGRFSDALFYARAALRNFESYGGRAKDMEDRAKGLIAEIEKAMKK